MIRILVGVLFVAVVVVLAGCAGGSEVEVTQAPSRTARPTRTAPTLSIAPTAAPTMPPTPTEAPPPPPTLPVYSPAQVIRWGNTSRNMVALTFDAGSDAGFTAMILDTLKANGIRASFGMTGRWAETNPDLLRRIMAEGHTLLNHSYDHPSFTGGSTGRPPLSRQERWDQLRMTEEVLQRVAGVSPAPYFRPPYGDYDESVNEDVGSIGYGYNVMWSVDSRGFTGISPEEITRICLEGARPGAIYIFHVGASSKDGAALQGIIDGLKARGLEMGDVPAVLAP